jgi:hypothetical protein
MLDLRAAANVTMATFSQAWTGSGSPVGFIIAISDASSGTGKLISVRGGSSGSTERFYIDRNGNGFMQNSLSCPNLYGLNNSTPLGIRNQTSSTSTINMDIVSIGRDRGVTNVMQSTAPSGTTNWVAVYPTYAQGTGATTINNDILVDRTETTIGTGTEQNLINLKVAGTSKFKVSNAGVMTVGGGVAQGGGIKHIRQTTGSIATASSALITITWATTFADANYTVVATVLDATTASASLEVVHIETQSASAITVRVKNTAAGSLTGTLNVIAIHD